MRRTRRSFVCEEQALEGLGVPEEEQVREWLAALDEAEGEGERLPAGTAPGQECPGHGKASQEGPTHPTINLHRAGATTDAQER
ncbi:MAG: hypothetical protein U9R79_17470 [Armatimonadota bacterium]|nr:hypothetical protein [Armatimonadota bacterium]